MLSKKEIKDIQSLSHKKFRASLNRFIAEGPKTVGELMTAVPHHIQNIYALSSWLETNKGATREFHTTEISPPELEKISQLQTPNQVLAVLNHLPSSKPPSSGFILYLDAIQDPGNFGTIIRIADWFGISNIVCSSGCADLYNPKVVQSTMASIARVNVYYDLEEGWLTSQKLPVFAATLHGKSLYQQTKVQEGILIVGNESKGIRPDLLELATEKITIPKRGEAESLNAAVATGIILSHLLG